MMNGKCGKRAPLCPLSFGLALGLTCAIFVYIWAGWIAFFGMPEHMMGHMPPPHGFLELSKLAGICLIKGFVAGLVFAWIYDMIACCCKAMWCCKGGSCGCNNPNCQCNSNKNGKV